MRGPEEREDLENQRKERYWEVTRGMRRTGNWRQ